MWIKVMLLACMVAKLDAFVVSKAPGEKFACNRNWWTFEPANCYIVSNDWAEDLNVTRGSLPCQRWDSNEPHAQSHGFNLFPDNTMKELGNKCRDPEGYGTPWCYTMDPEIEWQYCDVPKCVGDVTTPAMDDCYECECAYTGDALEIEVECKRRECPECPGKLVYDGLCCGYCDMTICEIDYFDYHDGQELPSYDPCETCFCVANGTHVGTSCIREECPVCHGERSFDDTCCGDCNEGCMYNDMFYQDDEEFEHECASCHCSVTEEGPTVSCVEKPCPVCHHERMRRPNEGACCDICLPGCYDNVTDRVYYGNEIIPRISPCESCECVEEEGAVFRIECSLLECLPCDGMAIDDGSCCGVCHMDGCVFESAHYDDGVEVPQADPCRRCTCVNDGEVSELVCAIIDCFCPGKRIEDGSCCGICEPGCFHIEEFYPEGSEIPASSPCDHIYCERGEAVMVSMACEPCMGKFVDDGSCCGVCTPGCLSGEEFFNEGAEIPMESPCESGFCHLGEIVVALMSCGVECPGRLKDDGSCCGQCEVGCFDEQGTFYELGDDVPKLSPCEFAFCAVGGIEVFSMSCPPCSDRTIDDGTCCGQCAPPSTGAPSTVGGPLPPTTESICDSVKCPKLKCPKALQFQNKDICCPECKCKKQGRKFMPGPVGKKCDGCVCDGESGNIACSKPECPPIQCVDPVLGDDCCYTCPNGINCLVRGNKGKVLPYGEFFRKSQYVCQCGGDGWYPYAFCGYTKSNKAFRKFLSYFPEGIFNLGKN